jgi:hypothetical protein
MSTTWGRLSVVTLLGASLAVPAGAKDLAASLRGKWLLDKAAAFEASAPPAYKAATPEKQKEMKEQVLKSMPDMLFEFTADTVSMKAGDQVHAASFKVTKTEKSTVHFDAVDKTKPGSAPDKLSAEFVDDDTVKLSKDGDPIVLILKRAR